MAGSATIDSTLFVDSLISIVDDVRRDIADGFGARQFDVATVQVTPPPRLGLGQTTCTETLLDPRPIVKPYKMTRELEPCGLDDAGLVQLIEVSLTYTEAELSGNTLSEGLEFFYKITDARGQGVKDRYFTLDRAPYPARTCLGEVDRQNDTCMGWIVWLRPSGAPACP